MMNTENIVEFPCSSCGKIIKTLETLSGRTIICRVCGARVKIPNFKKFRKTVALSQKEE